MIDLFVATVTWLGLGLPAAAVFWRAGRTELAIGVLPFAGMLALLIPVLAAAWSLGSLAWWGLEAIVAALVLGGCVSAFMRSAPEPFAKREPDLRTVGACLVVLCGFAAVHLHYGAVFSNGFPSYAWDAQQMWLVRAKVLAQSAQFPAAFYAEPLLDRSQWQYPLAYPATIAWMMKWASVEVRALHWPVAILAAVFPLASFALLVRSISPWLAAALALSAFTAPGLLATHHTALADPLLVIVVLSGCSCALFGVVRRDRGLEVIGGLALACAVSIKNDGTLWVLAGGLVSAALAWSLAGATGHRLVALATGLRVAGPSVLFFIVWDATCRRLGSVNEIPFDASELAPRMPMVLDALVSVIGSGMGWWITPACIGAILLMTPGAPFQRGATTAVLLALPGIYLAGIVLIQCTIYIPPPYDIAWLLNTSIARLTYGVVPSLFLLAVVAAELRNVRRTAVVAGGEGEG